MADTGLIWNQSATPLRRVSKEGAFSWLFSSDCLQHMTDHMERLHSSWEVELFVELNNA